MKKILSIALVALLAVSSVFAADFSGSASINFGYDFESKEWGFDNNTSKVVDITAEFKSGSVDKKGEGEIYAGIKAAFAVKFVAKQGTSSDFVGLQIPAANLTISEAYVTNDVWTVSILGAVGAPDFATSAAIDGAPSKKTYSVAAAAAPGFTVKAYEYTAAFGIEGDADEGTINWSAYVATPAYTLAEGLTAKFAAVAADDTNVGASTEIKYGEVATVQADFGYATANKAFGFDVAAKVAVDPVTVNAYYKYGDNLLSAKVDVKLLDEDALTLTATAKDILDAKALSLNASYKVNSALSVAANGAYTFKPAATAAKWSAGASATYTVEAFTAKAGATYKWFAEDAMQLYANASIESTAIIPGALLKLAYGPNSTAGAVTTNLLNGNYGSVDASCKISF